MTTRRVTWVCDADDLMAILRRAHDGEDPEMLYAEMYANSEVED